MKARRKRGRGKWRQIATFLLTCLLLLYGLAALLLLYLRWFAPPTTAVQVERRLSAWREHRAYVKRCRFVPLSGIPASLQHALIAAEDTRFFHHHGFDWQQMGAAIHQDIENGRRRGASTITQQLVRNLFLNTDPSIVRKLAEFSLVPLTELILPKRRILELYLNEIEWGPGVYGADAAAQYYYHRPAKALTRTQSVELASVIPAPLHRRPGSAEWYVAIIEQRMSEMGW